MTDLIWKDSFVGSYIRKVRHLKSNFYFHNSKSVIFSLYILVLCKIVSPSKSTRSFSLIKKFSLKRNTRTMRGLLWIYKYIKNCYAVLIASIISDCFLQKQPFANVFQNRSSQKFSNFHRKISVLESLFYKISGPKAWNFINKSI